MNINNPIICYNGTLIVDEQTNIISNVTISFSEAKQVVKLAKDKGIHVSLYKGDEWYVEKLEKWTRQESEITNVSPNIMSFINLFDVFTVLFSLMSLS
ncbi:HAD hydrolase family protein [Clostridium oryzae]|uniref:Haloacid dehalogenase-like hydrolase n=1 Tax=Clostridium oryzae TaxID=1450648 RepID=A0A1V4IVK1_9CLOT|nr:HAD hydrolase family protein [Clostridium oryzae]OPJ63815.1 haloacid dehalogenase-like hydrolase [Clostridium oryzae]